MGNENMIPNLGAVRREADAAAVRDAPAVKDEAALAGLPADQYELTSTGELVAWNGTKITARGPKPASVASVAGAVSAARTVVTPEQFGASGMFDPLQYGTAGWAAYAAANNASEAFAQMLQHAQQHPGTTIKLAGSYYLGPLSGDKQRQYGRRIYGPLAAIYDTNTVFARQEYEKMPVAGERITDLIIEGANCTLYKGQGTATAPIDTLWAFLECEGIHFTGTGKMLGFTPPNVAENTEWYSMLRFLVGTRNWSVGKGWHIGAFLGDGINVGGTKTQMGGTDAAWASYDGKISCSIRERWGNGRRPWDANGTRSRLAISLIHSVRTEIDTQAIYGGFDAECNVDNQLMIDTHINRATFPEFSILPLPANAHPWQEEEVVILGTSGSIQVESEIKFTCPQKNPIYKGNKITDTYMGYGSVYMHNNMLADIDGLKFRQGVVFLGNQDDDRGQKTTGASLKRISADTIIQREMYPQKPGLMPLTSSLIVLSGNTESNTLDDITLGDSRFAVIGLNPVPNNTGGNSETANTYSNCRNFGSNGGAGRVLGFTPALSSREFGSSSVLRSATKQLTITPIKTLALDANGRIDYLTAPAGEYVIDSATLINFFGFLNKQLIPEGARFTFRPAQTAGVNIPYTSEIHPAGNLNCVLYPGDEITMAMREGILTEVSRSQVPRSVARLADPNSATVSEVAGKVNELLAELRRLGKA